MKCASAVAAMTVIVLGTPAIALASTVSSGSGPGPGQVQIACALPHGKYACPIPRGCPPRPLVFDMASGSSTLTEVSGPVLAPPEEFGSWLVRHRPFGKKRF